MKDTSRQQISTQDLAKAWMVHFLTALGGVLGLFSLYAIHAEDFVLSFWLMGATILIDAVDGVLARRFSVKKLVPNIDGELLDNIVDYFNYVLVPAFFLMVSGLLPVGLDVLLSTLIVLSSAYQFCQTDAKTEDHFFKGFPSYWNLVVFYLFLWQTSKWINAAILVLLVVMVFVPIKYVYPSRLDYLSRRRWVRHGMLAATVLYTLATFALLWLYPKAEPLLVGYTIAYISLYAGFSIYRTLVPLQRQSTGGHQPDLKSRLDYRPKQRLF